jgi:O-antigen/teichoic acid export membrane protein
MARLLLPADYGIVAMAMLVVGLIQALMDFGATTALMRKAEISRDEIDSVWTLRTLQSLGMGAALLLVAVPASNYFHEVRVEYVLWVLAVCVALSGAGNIGVNLAHKEFNFALNFRIQVIGKVLGVLATIAGGMLLRDYRGLVIGIASSYVSGFIMTYTMHPYRPRWNTSRIAEIWALTKWLMLASVGGFILRKGDELLAGRIGTTADFGAYNVGADLGQLPTAEVGPALLNAFLPVLATMKAGAAEINAVVVKTASAVNTITMPLGLGFAAVAAPATSVLLGATWSSAAQYVAPFAVVGALQNIQNPYRTLLTMRGHTKVQSHAVWLEFVVFLIAAAALVPGNFLLGLVWARGLGSVASLGATLLATRKYCALALRPSAAALLRPLIGSVLMYVAVSLIINPISSDLIKLSVGIISGVLLYTTWSFVSWMAVGKPSGLEAIVMDFLHNNVLAKRRTK